MDTVRQGETTGFILAYPLTVGSARAASALVATKALRPE